MPEALKKPALKTKTNGEDQKRRLLVRRAHFLTIAAAWIVTVPAAAIVAGILFVLFRAVIV